ncbi:hypothetical protein [Hymenobacter sp. YC55]|uniref:hypothetical protein n=1 Tax=Hymenobacter sp. YC55 TaxID=3034019 RepID=UPI0023F9DADD|nr:hypothetical protein [Hymenobacter sp. YC55]MDF7814286.1 hypothetical protein [Hymenobacter sp. YC55]
MKHLLLISSFAASVLLAHSAMAQEGPERRRRHYNAQARAYYRGPVRFTAGGGVGLYSGDLGGLSENFPGGSVSLGLLYLIRPHLVIGAEGTYFQLGAKDQLPERGLAFKGQNISGVTFLRYELIRDESQFASPKRDAALVKPYIKAGAGLLLYNPNAYNGTSRPNQNTSYIRPERNDYPALAVVAPVGLGVVLRLTPRINATVEGAYYFTTTDHLDDVSQRANPNQNDGYGLVELKLEYAPWNR